MGKKVLFKKPGISDGFKGMGGGGSFCFNSTALDKTETNITELSQPQYEYEAKTASLFALFFFSSRSVCSVGIVTLIKVGVSPHSSFCSCLPFMHR